jgi:hypothetical protein
MSEGRAFAALAFYTGQREGEVCGRRWRDIDPKVEPLPRLDVTSQYDDRPLKTDSDDGGEHARKVPIHPELAATLKLWWDEGFEWTYCRKPTIDDFIVPRTKDGKCHTRSSGYKLFRAHAEACDVDNLSLHSTRHTFLTLTTRHGALREDAEKITHNRRGETVDEYIHKDWDQLCEVVLRFDAVFDEAQKRRAEEWRRRESNRALGPSEDGNGRLGTEEPPDRQIRKNDDNYRNSLPTIARVNGSRQARTRSKSRSFRSPPEGVQRLVEDCLNEARPLVMAGDAAALEPLERAARAIDGAFGGAVR